MTSNRLYQKYKKRLNSFNIVMASLTLILLFNFFAVQVIFSNSYKSEISNKTKTYKINKGKRGSIFDRNNNLLAYPIQKCRFWVNTNNNLNKNEILDFFSNYLNEKLPFDENILDKKSNYLVLIDNLISYENSALIEKSKSIKSLQYNFYNHQEK